MKFFILIITFNIHISGFGQNYKKSDSIFSEIKSLSQRNNRLIVESFLSNHTDSTYAISYLLLGKDKVRQFVKSEKDLSILEDSFALVVSAMDSIRRGFTKFTNLESTYDSANTKTKLQLRPEFMKLNRELGTTNPEYGRLFHSMELLRSKINRQVIIRLLSHAQKNGEILPTKFIPADELGQINETLEIKKNDITIETLYLRYREVLLEEICKKY